jgi:hypothetical protein
MDDNGGTKDDVKLPEGELGERIKRQFHDEGKDLSKCLFDILPLQPSI